ncbi:MAG: hypothetical protein M3539_06190 [Acidobacteriota bacterium]|nr:hypothetical protein [Acidobacteriota bacterium]
MVNALLKGKLLIEISLFILTTGLLTYFAEEHKWAAFCFTALSCLAMFLALKHLESSQFNSWLKELIGKEYEFAVKFDKSGIANLYNMQDGIEKSQRNIDTAKIIMSGASFCLSGSTGASYIDPSVHRHWDHVRTRLNEGCSFKLLLTNPFCESKQVRNSLNMVDTEVDPKLNLMVVRQLRNKYPHFEVRFTNEVYCSLFFSEKEMMYDPYHLGQVNERLENQFVAFRVRNVTLDKAVSCYTQLRRHFEFLWSNGVDFDSFISLHREQLKAHIDINVTS